MINMGWKNVIKVEEYTTEDSDMEQYERGQLRDEKYEGAYESWPTTREELKKDLGGYMGRLSLAKRVEEILGNNEIVTKYDKLLKELYDILFTELPKLEENITLDDYSKEMHDWIAGKKITFRKYDRIKETLKGW